MPNLRKILKIELRRAKKIAFLGVGSDLRGDDVAGESVVRQLQLHPKKEPRYPLVEFFFGATAPENLTGEIKKFNPSHIVIIDSAELGKKAGTIKLITPNEIGGVSFSTHRIPTKIMVDYLAYSLKCKIIIIGIQPKSIVFGKSLSKEVKKSVKELSLAIKEVIYGIKPKRKSYYKSNWHLYIVKCKDSTLYTGITTDISRRLKEHNSKRGAFYTKNKTPVLLVYQETLSNQSAAFKREAQIKRWPRAKKLALIERKSSETT